MKHLTLIIALLWALGASGQIYIDSYRFGAPAANLLLDDYAGAVRAYSLRLLRTAYTGDCIEVRRSNDNTTSNIGFSGGVLDTATLKTFCASTDCFVRTWYDQSTAGENATQTTNANQARIVLNGVIDRRGGSPCLVFDGTSDLYVFTGFTPASLSNWSSYAVFERASTGINTSILYGIGANVEDINWTTSNVLRTRIQALMTTTRTDTGLFIYSAIRGSSTLLAHLNDVQVNSQATASLNTNTLSRLGGVSTTLHSGAMFEVIVWDADWTADRGSINTNINSFYNIY